MPELDTIRGLAILGVLLYHGFYWARDVNLYTPAQRLFLKLMSPGQFGVNLFFVLSGFLITGILVDSRNRQDYYKRFYVRRALRILPAYYATLGILVVFGITTKSFLWMSLLYSSNLSLLFGIAMSYGVLWSLAVEEHFYLIWPTVVRKVSPHVLLWSAVAILLASPALRFLCALPQTGKIPDAGCSYYTWNCADGLALGAIMAILVRRMENDRGKLKRLSILLAVAGLSIGVIGVPLGITTRMNPIGEALQWIPWNLGFASLLGFFLLAASGGRESYVTPRPLTFLGNISYGLYLYHQLFFGAYDWASRRTNLPNRLHLNLWQSTWFRVLLSSLAAILFAYASRRWFEEPFLRMKERFTQSENPSSAQRVAALPNRQLDSGSEAS